MKETWVFRKDAVTAPLILTCQNFFGGREAIEIVLSCSEEGEARRASGSRLNARRGTYIEYVKLGRDPIQTKIKARNSFTRFEETVPRSVIPDKEPHVIIVDHYCSNMDALVVFMSADPKT